jgi:kumamolisin
MPSKSRLKGSERTPLAGARAVGPADPNERTEVTVRLRPRESGTLEDLVGKLTRAKSGRRPQFFTREEFERTHASAAEDIEKVAAFARASGLVVVETSASRRSVVLSGTVAALSRAFGVRLQTWEHEGGTYRGRTGPVQLPVALRDVVQGVFGLDDRPQAKPHFRVQGGRGNILWHAGGRSYTPPELARLYGFPTGLDGKGECIGIIELGGGYRPADLATYFKSIGVTSPPKVVAVSVDHASNHPTGDPNGPDGEVALDIEVAGAVAPGAKIAVYFAPNTDRGFLDAITTAVHDTTNRPSVISISWGGPESSWTGQAMTAFDQAFQEAAALGVTVCCASGDDGSSDGVSDGKSHVDFPASSPSVLACGGTRLDASGGSISSEVVWNDGPGGGAGGGGFSVQFARPTWQPAVRRGSRKRGVPDVAGNADPATGYRVRVDGVDTVIGGTSAVAPLWAALIALVNQLGTQPCGFLNPTLYAHPKALRDVTAGNNGAFKAAKGWDPCTGLGSPGKAPAWWGSSPSNSRSRASSRRG